MNEPLSIAVVGVGGIFPGAPDLDTFWQNILAGTSLAREIPAGRWHLAPADAFDSRLGELDKAYSRRACFVADEELVLDPTTLAVSEDYLAGLDPLFRLLVYAGQKAWHDGGGRTADPARTGVVVGNLYLPTDASTDLAREMLGRTFEEKVSPVPPLNREFATDPRNRYVAGLPAGILAQALGLGGGSHTLDAACASSLYALKLAVDELVSGRADVMLAGGVSRPSCQYTQMGFSQLRALSPTGRPSPFDERGDGLVVGEGAGIFVLKRLADARQAGDHIYGVIRGIGLSNDVGGRLLAPTSEGQLRAMRAAYEQARWEPEEIDLIECHATGIPMGDAVEFASLRSLWGEAGQRRSTPGDDGNSPDCVIGSVKSNVGHLLTAAASAAFVKVLYALKEKTLPPTANFTRAPSALEMGASPFTVLSKPREWSLRPGTTARKAAISAFGFGGINAHVLVEEWVAPEVAESPTTSTTPEPVAMEIAVVGMDARFGPWQSLRAFSERVLGGGANEEGLTTGNWWGAEQSDWFKEKGLGHIPFKGYYLDDIKLPRDRFRIPPKEMTEMLPQQLLMLAVAVGAWRDARRDDQGDNRSGVYVGLGLDLNTTNFQVRWSLLNEARAWNRRLNLNLSEAELAAWVGSLRDALCPPLTANRVMGSLGSVVASRIARELRLGGPSFVVSSEETSGIMALRAALRALTAGEIDTALVGAVDLAGDLRAVLGANATRPCSVAGKAQPFDIAADGYLVGEGAAAVTLKRLADALADGDRIYGVIKGVGVATGGAVEETYNLALERAYAQAGVAPGTIGYLDAHGSGCPAEDDAEAAALAGVFNTRDSAHDWREMHRCILGSAKADIGHTGAAAGMASLVKACLCLHQEVLPPLRNIKNANTRLLRDGSFLAVSDQPEYWLHNRAAGPRRAAVSAIGVDGNCTHLVLEALSSSAQGAVATPSTTRAIAQSRQYPLGTPQEALFVCVGEGPAELLTALADLRDFVEKQAPASLNRIDILGHRWWQRGGVQAQHGRALSLVARTVTELLEQISLVRQALNNDPESPLGGAGKSLPGAFANDRIFYSPKPLGIAGENKLAFVFPGSGNQFAEMGRNLFLQFPEILRDQHGRNKYLCSQYRPDIFWSPAAWREPQVAQTLNNQQAMMLGQVSLGTAVSDLVRYFGVSPEAVIGYSLGETVGLFSLGAWTSRDEMVRRLHDSTLFTSDLAGDFDAARKRWKLEPSEAADWVLGVINRPMSVVKSALKNRKEVYGLIANTLHECVVGGARGAVKKIVDMLQCEYVPIDGVTTAHCEIVKEVEKPYRDLHLFKTTPPPGVQFYSGAWGKAYPVDREKAADAILAHAVEGVDYPKTIEAAYQDGVRIFLEMGPGASCTRLITNILGDRPHLARSFCYQGQNAYSLVLRGLGQLLAERVPLTLDRLYGMEPVATAVELGDSGKQLLVPVGGQPFTIPTPPVHQATPAPVAPAPVIPEMVIPAAKPVPPLAPPVASPVIPLPGNDLTGQIQRAEAAKAEAHQLFLQVSANLTAAMSETIALQMSLPGSPDVTVPPGLVAPSPAPVAPVRVPETSPPAPVISGPIALDRKQCMEFAIGQIGRVFGATFAEVDSFPSRVRLPDEPLMLVDRVVEIEGEPLSMTKGRIVTEHDVWPGSWYLDAGRTPVCIAVEAGQADLMLSGYLGADHQGRGLAVYRLLDAEITFHRDLPRPGETIRYDIRIERFFEHNHTWFFRFQFDGTSNGEPLLTMRNGCAGFFTEDDLAAGQGIVLSKMDVAPRPGKLPSDWQELVPQGRESYTEEQVDALRRGDLATCFGPDFSGLTLGVAQRLPEGRMRLVHRVVDLDPAGGRFGLGRIRAEADIHPDDWFLTCHFKDDMVMPGTLMYECCNHTLRIFLLRLGWITEGDQGGSEPVGGMTSRLRCRGQVLQSTKVVTYEVDIKEIGYGPEPYAIADAHMYSDGKHIVVMEDMSVRFAGLDREGVEALWQQRRPEPLVAKAALYDHDRILAFAVGKPSEAFGVPYQPFDADRVIARLPGPPYCFIDRITAVTGKPFEMVAGGIAEGQYLVPPGEWYFAENRTSEMPFAVLLEVALQVCGWLSSYVGSALQSDQDLSYRNLGGEATQFLPVTGETGLLETRVKMTSVAKSGGMIIQEFELAVRSEAGLVYRGTTNFGFFSKAALAQQLGVQGVNRYQPDGAEISRGRSFPYPEAAPFPAKMLQMIDRVELYVADGGPAGLGFIRGVKEVDPTEWFFAAHFHQDPVTPGSLGLEAFIQLLKVVAGERWGMDRAARLGTLGLHKKHKWVYRGQVTPTNKQVKVEAVIKAIDDEQGTLLADGFLVVDDTIVYQMIDFPMELDTNR